MPYSISTLLTRNLHDVFGENDPVRRRAAIDEIFTEDCVLRAQGASTVAATRSIASRPRSRLLTLTSISANWPGPRSWAMAGGSNGYRAALVSLRLTPGLISSLPRTAGFPPFISFSTSYRELDSAVPENWREGIPTGPRWRLPGRWSATCSLWSAGIRTSCLPRSSAERRQLKNLSNKEGAKTSGFIDAQTARSCSCRLGEGANSGGSLRIVSGLAENTNSIICDGSSEPETANGCPVLHRQEPHAERHRCATRHPD